MFSPLHIISILMIIPTFLLGKHINKGHVPLLSLILCLMEIFKQLYYLSINQWTLWIFPFQLCSIPLYLFIFYKKYNEYIDSFLLTYALIGGTMAIIYPQDMIIHGTLMTIHSFLWHYLMILMSSVIYFHKERYSYKDYIKGTYLFLFVSVVAILLNIILNRYGSIDLFYLNPYLKPTQPIISELYQYIGIIPSKTTYILLIMTGSYIIYKIMELTA